MQNNIKMHHRQDKLRVFSCIYCTSYSVKLSYFEVLNKAGLPTRQNRELSKTIRVPRVHSVTGYTMWQIVCGKLKPVRTVQEISAIVLNLKSCLVECYCVKI